MPESAPETATTLAALLRGRHRRDASVAFEVPSDWLQGRTTFGGLTSALLLQAMRDIAGASWEPGAVLRALQTNFIGPVEQGPVHVEVATLREGRSVRQVQATMRQNGQVAAMAVGVFASDRASSLPLHAPVRPAVARGPEVLARKLPAVGARPSFTRHFDMRWAEGTPPTSGVAEWDAKVHMRLTDDDADQVSAELLAVMFADATPSPASSHFTAPAAASSIAWALELMPFDPAEPVAGWWRADNHVPAARGGYVNAQSTLWAPSGALAALSTQVVAVYG